MTWSTVLFSLIFSSFFLNTFAIMPLHRRTRETSPGSDSVTFYRLPNNTKPEAYNLFISTDIADGIFDYYGVVKINITILEKSNEVTLHQYELDIQAANLTSEQGKEIPIQSPHYDLERDFVIFKTINHTFTPGERIFLEVKYKGILRQDMYGFYCSSYVESKEIAENFIDTFDHGRTYTKRWLATTQFEPTYARRAFPCYDEPALKATFDIEISHSSTYTAISNMPEVEQKISGSKTITRFQQTPLMSTYLVAFVVSDFDFKEKITANGFRHRIYAEPDEIDDLTFALDKSDKILTAMSNYLGVNYTLPKIDHASIPDFQAAAMENWGLITYRRECFAYRQNYIIDKVISHELAHQFFGNLVTPKWWNYLWLNEGFATLFSYIGIDLVEPTSNAFQIFAHDELREALLYDDYSKYTKPMSYYVESPSAIKDSFDKIAYKKSSSVLRMFMHAFTENSFRKGLKYYLTKNAYKAVTDLDLFESWERAVKEDGTLDKDMNVRDIFSSWSDQNGYPLLIVTRNYTDNTIKITQERYSNEPHEANPTSWWIPYNFDTSNNIAMNDTRPDGWLAKGMKSKIIKPTEHKNWTSNDWVLFNKQQTGFYRVLYDERNYRLILDDLKSGKGDKIHSINKAQLLDDIYQLVRSKRLTYNLFDNFWVFIKALNED